MTPDHGFWYRHLHRIGTSTLATYKESFKAILRKRPTLDSWIVLNCHRRTEKQKLPAYHVIKNNYQIIISSNLSINLLWRTSITDQLSDQKKFVLFKLYFKSDIYACKEDYTVYDINDFMIPIYIAYSVLHSLLDK